MLPRQISEDFWRRQQKAQKSGRDVWEALDREGLLVTPDRRRELKRQALWELFLAMDGSSAHQWLDRDAKPTPLDMFNSIKRRIREMAEEKET